MRLTRDVALVGGGDSGFNISAPLDCTRVAARMDTLACLPYRVHVLRGLLDRAHAFATHHPARAHYRPSDLAAIKRFRSFDGDIIVPMHGFEDVDDYYWEASSGRWLDRVRMQPGHVPLEFRG